MSKTDATNNKVMRGTPLINSINPTQIIFITGKFDCLPNANRIPIGKDATIYLLDQGVRLTGTDAWSWDAPFTHTAKKFEKTKDPSLIWEGHRAGMHKGYSHIEKLCNLEQLPDKGFLVSAFPFKIKNGSAGFVRVVAILDE